MKTLRREDRKETAITAIIKNYLKIKAECKSANELSPEILNKLRKLVPNLRTVATTYFKKYGVDPALTSR